MSTDAARQVTLQEFPPKPAGPLTIQRAVYFILDWEAEFRDRRTAYDKENLWKLTHRVSALLGRAVNPETVARRRRDYWRKVV